METGMQLSVDEVIQVEPNVCWLIQRPKINEKLRQKSPDCLRELLVTLGHKGDINRIRKERLINEILNALERQHPGLPQFDCLDNSLTNEGALNKKTKRSEREVSQSNKTSKK